MDALGTILAFIQAIIWACTTLILRSLSTRLDAFLVNGLRAALSLVIIIPAVILTGGLADLHMLTPMRILYLNAAVIVGGVLGDALYVTSLRILGVGRAFPISNSFPLFTMAFSAILLGTRLTWTMALGGLLVLSGVYLVARPRKHVLAREVRLDSPQLIKGAALGLCAAAFWGLTSVVLTFGLQDGINAALATGVRIPLMVLLCLLASARRGTLVELRRLDRHTWLALLAAGVLGWGLAASIYSAAIQISGPSKTAIIGATSPLFAVPLSAIFLHERPTRYTLVGTVLSVAGIALVL